MIKYATDIDREALLDTLSTKEGSENFLYGFYSCLTYCKFLSMTEQEKIMWCGETQERIIYAHGEPLLESFLKAHDIDFTKEEKN